MKATLPGPLAASLLAAALVLTLPSLAAAGTTDTFVFQGDLHFEAIGSYPLLPFTVPPGTTVIEVAYDYTWPCSEDDGKGLLDPVLDIGIYDPEMFRGWSGSRRSSFVVSESRELTTDGYLPGVIPPGEWAVELGLGLIHPDMVMSYTVEVELRDDPVGEPFVRPEREDVVLSGEARWYLGDLHCHSTHSDGAYPMEEVFDYAESVGLDFIALTDHNGFSHWMELPEMQARFPDLLLLYGEEMTSYRGHGNVYNIDRPVDYHGTAPDFDLNAVLRGVRDDGGYVSPNHPSQPFVPLGETYIGWGWAYPETDWDLVSFFEVVNGPSAIDGSIPNVLNTLAILWWENLLDGGHRITAIGGSDDHAAGRGSGPIYAPIGVPTTAVYARELSPGGLFEAIEAGRVTILAEGPDGPWVDFTAQAGGEIAMVGDTVTGDKITFRVEVTGGTGRTLTLWNNGSPWLLHGSIPVDADPFVLTVTVTPFKEGRLRVELKDGPFLSAMTNPIYFRPAAGVCTVAKTSSGASRPALSLSTLSLALLLFALAGRRGVRPQGSSS